MIKQVHKRLTRNCHAQLFGMGEIGLSHVSRFRRLAENDVTLRTLQRPPLSDAPFQRAPDTIVGESQRMQALKVAQQGDGLKRGVVLQQGEKVVLPVAFKRVHHRASMRNFAAGRQRRIGIETPGTAFTEPGAGGRGSLAVVLKIGHINSHLLVGDGFVGQPESSV